MEKRSGKKMNDRQPVKVVVTRAHEYDNGNISFDMILDDWLYLYGLTLIWSKKSESYFVSFAQKKDKNDQYWNWYYFEILPEEQDEIERQIEEILDNKDKK